MTYNKETNLLNDIEDIKEVIRSSTFNQLLKETHENNIILKEIIKFINTYLSNHNNENDNDFFRNVLANLLSNGINIKR